MFTPIFGTRQLLYLYEHDVQLPEDAVLVFECKDEVMPSEILARFVNHGCNSSEYLRLIDLISSGKVVTVSGDYYTGKNQLETVTIQQFIDEQVAAGRRDEFAKRIAEACDYAAKRRNWRTHRHLIYIREF